MESGLVSGTGVARVVEYESPADACRIQYGIVSPKSEKAALIVDGLPGII